MKILATVSFRKGQVTNEWEFLEINGTSDSYLVISRLPSGRETLVIPLTGTLMRDMKSGGAEKVYVGGLDVDDAFVLLHA